MSTVSSLPPLNQFYNGLLNALNIRVDENGDCLFISSDGEEPYILSDVNKLLTVPTDDNLRSPDYEKRVYFHPLVENPLRSGESIIMKSLTRLIQVRVTQLSIITMQVLLTIAADTQSHGKLKGKQHELLSVLSDLNEKNGPKVLKEFEAIRKRITATGEYRVFSTFIKSAGTLNNVKYSRVCHVRFPLYEELVSDDPSVFGVSFGTKKKERDILRRLMEFIFPNIDEQYHYSRGSGSLIATSFLASINAFGAVAIALNRITKLFGKYIPEAIRSEIDLSWMSALDNVTQWRDIYPAFEECKGELDPSEKTNTQTKSFDASKANNTSTVPLTPTTSTSSQQQSTTAADVATNKGTFAGFNVSESPFQTLGPSTGFGNNTSFGTNQKPTFNAPVINNKGAMDSNSFLGQITGRYNQPNNNGFQQQSNQGFHQNNQGFNSGFNSGGFNQGFNNSGGFGSGSVRL